MPEFYTNGDSIDGKKVYVEFKRIQRQPNTYIISPTGFKGIKYKCSRDGSTEITSALPVADAQQALEKHPSVHLLVGDRLKCNRAYFIAESRKSIDGSFSVKMMSGRHECLSGQPDVRIYAEIEAPFEQIARAAEKKLIELKKEKEGLLLAQAKASLQE